MDKDKKMLKTVAMIASVVFLMFDLFLNYRVANQTGYLFYPESGLMSDFLSPVSSLIMSLSGFLGVRWVVFVLKGLSWVLLVLFSFGAVYKPDKVLSKHVYLSCLLLSLVYFLFSYYTPFQNYFVHVYKLGYGVYGGITLMLWIVMVYYFSQWGKTLQFFTDSADDAASIKDDPFGREKRYFPQESRRLENIFSVNIPYRFMSLNGWIDGFINIINPFRGNLVMGPPGSGKTYGTFLPAIYQFIMKGFCMVVYDFKFSDLTEYSYHCYLAMLDKVSKEKENSLWKRIFFNKKIPEFVIFSLDDTLYSERCNVFQPHHLKNFTDVLALNKAFFIALNPSWRNKEGDFFPESAINFSTACCWALRCFTPSNGKRGSYCTLPHLIEFVSQDVDTIVNMVLKMEDPSLRNVIKAFEEAKRDGALEQLQGQMGTVRISLTRMTSPNLYYLLTEEQDAEPFDLQVNSKDKPKILSLANSGQNAGVNNIVLSLFLVQISRFVNIPRQNPLGMMFDEAVTLSYPKSTIDTLVATGRSRLISVWLGIQDKEQLTRDLGKDVADALFNMMGNYFVGNVRRDTAKWISEEIGDIRVLEKNKSISKDGEISYSYTEKEIRAVPPSFVSDMSQGTMVGKLSDDIDQKLRYKSFYGEIQFDHPFKEKVKKMVPVYNDRGDLVEVEKIVPVDKELPKLPYSKYWRKIIAENCEGMDKAGIDQFVDQLMDINFKRVVSDIGRMKAELLDGGFDEDAALQDAFERMEVGAEENKKMAIEFEKRKSEDESPESVHVSANSF